jgi:integrase
MAKRDAYRAEAGKPKPAPSEKEKALVNSQTVAEFAQVFLENRRAKKRAATCDDYEKTLRLHVLPHIGGVPIVGLTDTRVLAMYADLESKVSPSKRVRVHVTLRAMLNYAKKSKKVIVASPLETIEKDDIPTKPKLKIHPLTESQVTALYKAAKGDRLEALFVLAIDSGARQGELFGLTWENVDLDKAVIHIRQAAAESSEGVFVGETKTGKERPVPINADTVKALRARKVIAKREGLDGCEYVFPTEGGYVLRKSNFDKKTWGPIRTKAKLTCRFHDLRHTCATFMFKAGAHPKQVQERLGHASIVLTMETYAAFIPSMQVEATKALGNMLGRLRRKAA